jgi:peptide/nickel transport system permease protein
MWMLQPGQSSRNDDEVTMTLPTTEVTGSPMEPDVVPDQTTTVVSRSPMRLAAARFRRDYLSMIALSVVVLVVIAGLLAPLLVTIGFLDPTTFHQDLIDPTLGGLPLGGWSGASGDHWLGVEPSTGRDVMSRLWYGITFSLAIALSASILAVGFGTALGIIAGVSGGFTDSAVGRLIDLVLSFPSTLMLLALSTPGIIFLDETLHIPAGPNGDIVNGLYVVLVLAAFGWPPVARLIRGQVLSLREREFVEAARLLGASRFRLYFREILPNLWAPILVTFTITMPAYVSAEAALNFLGVGITPPTPTLGNVLSASLNWASADPFFFFAPAFMIMTIVLSFNLLGDGLRDALDPKGDR